MTESFFDRLELELRAAAQRPPRRLPRAGSAGLVLAVVAAIALALVPAAVLLGSGDDGVIREPVFKPKPHMKGHVVVATGTAPVAGQWQMEFHRNKNGLPCLTVWPRNGGAGGYCGRFRRTPGFGRAQLNVRLLDSRRPTKVREVLLYGPVPARARKLLLTATGIRREIAPVRTPQGSFYLTPVRLHMKRARINWLDANGRPGSRGIALMPPATGHVKR